MRFSIITITYNAEKFLAQTLDSVAKQTFGDYEHIVFDGGSTDQTCRIVSDFPHAILYQGKDRGIADAMNKGALLAKGEYLLHLHADDLLATERSLAIVNTALKTHRCDWLYGMASVINEEGRCTQNPSFVSYQKERLEKYNCLAHPATFVKRSLFESVGGFDSELKLCMDYDLWLRLAKRRVAFALPAHISCFRAHSGSLSTKESLRVADEAYLVRNRHVKGIFKRIRSWRTWKRRRKRCFS